MVQKRMCKVWFMYVLEVAGTVSTNTTEQNKNCLLSV